MVDLTPELAESLGMIKRPKPHEYEEVPLPSFERKQVGPNARIEIPLNSRVNLGTVAGMLRALAAHYDRLRDDTSLTDKHALDDAGHAARLVTKELRRLEIRSGRKAWNSD